MAEEQNNIEAVDHRKNKKQITGVVTSNKMDKSITIQVERKLRHPLYGKFVKKSKKFMAHDENNECNEGDTVTIIESRPLSAKKRWKLVEIVERAK
jgi:small subunit ribosomal protein S17